MRQRSSTGLKRGGGGGEEERRRLEKHVYMKIPDDKGQQKVSLFQCQSDLKAKIKGEKMT